MKYFIDTEFREGPQDKTFLGFKYGETKPTIDLISIGIVSEDDRTYYAVCNEFNIDQAWADEWLRENVLKKIFYDFAVEHYSDIHNYDHFMASEGSSDKSIFKKMVGLYGKPKSQIAKEVEEFCTMGPILNNGDSIFRSKPEFWAYYADYDWVVFCWIFGRMLDLPKGFPMYCRDIKQMMDDLEPGGIYDYPFGLNSIKDHHKYPKNTKEHHALHDAMFDKNLHQFLTKYFVL